MTFGRYLRHLRFMRKMPLNQLAAATGLCVDHLVELETDKGVPNLEDIAKLAAALNVPEEGLMEKARHVRPGAL